jgi:hypothetical protein
MGTIAFVMLWIDAKIWYQFPLLDWYFPVEGAINKPPPSLLKPRELVLVPN